MKILSKQLKVKYDDVYNGIAVEQALVAKANIHTIQNGAFYCRDQSTNQNYFQLYLNSTERNQFDQFYKSNNSSHKTRIYNHLHFLIHSNIPEYYPIAFCLIFFLIDIQ
ncbi:hypothetical protein RFI_36795 [Reticulomyxa filosa]|uniref:Uncharacterized protein n=1 Tax=Reticulomyxa filosa TaxID=46433 RepID=X6LGD0_RETFI|nr:hypothetical protein RFI_36795 [Reticulomyxa filosa]|eukprot:ETO00644.1 hypothetical protein RFI_36795 [Reticulomyxa filosa]